MKYRCSCGNFSEVSDDKYKSKMELYCSSCQEITFWKAFEWPNVQMDREIWYNGDTYWKSPSMGKCFECGEVLTQWMSLSFEGYLCNPLCSDKAWRKFFGEN